MIDYKPNEVVKKISKDVGEWSYSVFVDQLNNKNVESVSLLDNSKAFIVIDKNHGTELLNDNFHVVKTFQPLVDNAVELLNKNNIPYDVFNVPLPPKPLINTIVDNVFLGILLYFILTTFLPIILRLFSMNLPLDQNSPRFPGSPMAMNPFSNNGNSEFDLIEPGVIEQTFEDVAGIDTIKYELVEIVDYLKNPEKYSKVDANIPKGVLLEGSPGVGKTLLARAVAGEAEVAFISVSGSQFIEMFVGLGAARVRRMFAEARKREKCIIFIDEIDAIGKQRGGGGITGSGNEEREQTLNQILTEMDGFNQKGGVIVIAATNRVDLLDSALVRPGRFDRKITVPMPDTNARIQIFNLLSKNKTLDSDISISEISQLTSGYSGAKIKNLLNEASILTARNNNTSISRDIILEAIEKIEIGLPINKTLDPKINELVAFHEAGHTICTLYFDSLFNLSKTTIKPTSNGAGGYTLFTPIESMNMYPTKKYFLSQLIIALGGRAAESILYNNYVKSIEDNIFNNTNDLFITTGASQDLIQAYYLAEQYVTRFGFGKEFLGYRGNLNSFDTHTSELTKDKIDDETQKLIMTAYNQSLTILNKNLDNLYYISDYLIENYTITNVSNIDIKYI
tara:strand:+ start:5232 stop:7100 length:1869 start_codon:yes stop_codon:yes gene_type:complete